MKPEILQYFQKLIFEETGIVYNEKNSFALEARLDKVSQKLEFKSVEELFQSCRGNIANDVKSFIFDIATNNETSFFRDMHVFKAVEELVLKPLLATGKKHFEFWSAACSAGQEVYSLVFLLEDFKARHPGVTYHIVGSDISQEILARARAGEYSQLEVQRGLPTLQLVKYFERADGRPGEPVCWRIKDEFRRGVSFKSLNLLKPFPAIGPFDVVFLRNVLIYHDEEHRFDILNRIHGKMAIGGRLFLGSAERAVGLDHVYEIGVENRAVFYKALQRTKVA